MPRMLLPLAAALALLALSAPASAAAEPQDVLVRFANSADASERQEARDEASTDLQEVLPLRGLQLVDPEPGVTAGEAIEALEDSPDVLYAEPDLTRTASVLPDDEFFNVLWGMNNTGQNVDGVTGTPDADIDAPEAWNVTTGSAAVTVGILDSGVDATQPDLAANIWTNPDETANGSDDDGNGLVDDLHGWDWVSGDSNPADQNGHGTHVSGTVGGRGNDSTGVAGVAWNVRLAPLRVLDASGEGNVSDLIKGYAYARQKGIPVVNASLGASGASQAERDAMAAASDTLFVVAAGNDSLDNDTSPTYPCSYDLANIVCVAATDSNDALASFSSYGHTTVDLAAPGVLIGSSWPGSLSPCPGSPCWVYSDGTSMATPHVAGTAALVLAHSPGASPAQVKSALLGSAEPKPSLAGMTVTGGRLNAFAAVTGELPSGTAAPPAAPKVAPPAAPQPSAPVLAFVDRLPPALRLGFRRQTVRSVRRYGFKLQVRSSEAAGLRAELLVPSGTGTRRVRAGYVLVGRKSTRTDRAATVNLRVRLTARARRKLRGLHRVRVRLRVRAVDRRGNARVATRRLLLR